MNRFKPGDKATIKETGNEVSILKHDKYGYLVTNPPRRDEWYLQACDLEPIEPVQEEESQLDYPAAARAIALWLKEFCDENLPYPDMIAECARRASKEISRLKSEIEELKRKA